MLFHFSKKKNLYDKWFSSYKRISEKSSKFSWFLGPQKFSTSQKPSQTHITLVWNAYMENYFQLAHIYCAYLAAYFGYNLPGLIINLYMFIYIKLSIKSLVKDNRKLFLKCKKKLFIE